MPEFTLGLTQGFSHGRAFSEILAPTVPAVGTALTLRVGGRYWERPIALAFTVSAGADDVVSDVTVTIKDGLGGIVAVVETGPAISASTSASYSLFNSWSGASAWSNGIVNATLPDLFLQPTWTVVVQPIGTWTEGQITAIRYYVERFQTGPGGYLQGDVEDVEGERFMRWLKAQLIAS